MFYNNKIWIGNSENGRIELNPKMANRHGLIAGATGTGKTVTLKVLAESFADAGVPVFMSDVKGDLSGMCKKGEDSENMQERIKRFGLDECGFSYTSYNSVFWDVYGENGIPLRTTISEMGPILMSKLMELNDTQSDILTCLFKMADDEQLLLVDLKDLKSVLQYAQENCAELSKQYGNITKASVAAIIRAVVALEAAGGDKFFNEPAINIADFFQGALDGRGTINILDGRALATDTTMYSAFLLYLLSELFETLPEVGDLERPRMVFFFDEAHLLFKDMSKALQNKIEQIVKLIRSKGVGLYFITQSPADIPNGVLGQLGNKIQHALHAYTPAEERAIKTAADSFRANPAFSTKDVLTTLGVGEALVSVLDDGGVPTMVEKVKILPPRSLMGPASDEEKSKLTIANNLFLKYKDTYEVDSAYEFLERQASLKAIKDEEDKAAREAEKEAIAAQKAAEKEALAAQKAAEKEALAAQKAAEKEAIAAQKAAEKEAAKKNAAAKRVAKSVANTAAGSIGREAGQLIGGAVGGSMGKKIGGNIAASLGRSIMGTLFK